MRPNKKTWLFLSSWTGCVTSDVMLLKHPVLSWAEQRACSMWVNVADVIDTKCTWRLKTDYRRNTVHCKCMRCPKTFCICQRCLLDAESRLGDCGVSDLLLMSQDIPTHRSLVCGRDCFFFGGGLTHMRKFTFRFPMCQQFVCLQIVLKAPGSRQKKRRRHQNYLNY